MSLVQDRTIPLPAGAVTLKGRLGERLKLSVENRLKKLDYSHLVAPFKERDERDGRWRCEFWGKIVRSAILSWRGRPDAELLSLIKGAVDGVLAAQTPDGCISSYPSELQTKDWDIWGRKYVLIGLARYYLEIERSEAVKKAMVAMLDHLITQVGPAALRIVDCGHHVGLAASSLLEPVVLTYRISGERRFLDYALWIAGQGGSSSGDIFKGALKGVPPAELGNGKAYEMMSCFEGLSELYRETGNSEYKESVLAFYAAVRDKEIFITGVGGLKDYWGEFWYDGRLRQTQKDVGALGETCVTTTWIKYCGQVLRLSGDSTVVDEMERTLYNGVLGAMLPDGSWWMHRNPTPLAGPSVKIRAGDQIPGYGEDCCLAQGPKALAMAPWLAVMKSSDGAPLVNLYEDLTAEMDLSSGVSLRLAISGGFPRAGELKISVSPSKPARFAIRLRIPAWSENSSARVGADSYPAKAGSYLEIVREWKTGDLIELSLDMRVRVIDAFDASRRMAVMRGPVVLAQDSRLGAVDAPVSGKDALVAKLEASPAGVFDCYRLGDGSRLCDYSSAGNEFDERDSLCVWLPKKV